MNYERATKLNQYANELIYSYLAFDRLPGKFRTISIHYFFLLLLSSHIAKNRGGSFVAFDLVSISHYKRRYVFKWLRALIERDFLQVSSKSVFCVSPFGYRAISQYYRILYRLIDSDKLPGYLNGSGGAFDALVASDINKLKKSS